MVVTPSRAANQAKSKMAAILSENSKNSHEASTNSPRMMVLVSKCRFINSRINMKTTKKPVCQISSSQIQDGRQFIGKLEK